MNKNIVKVIKIASLVASVIGMIGSSWAESQENKDTIKELIDLQIKGE